MRTITMYNKDNLKQAEAVYDKLYSITRKLKWEINKLKEQSFSLTLKEESGKCVKDAYLTFLDKEKGKIITEPWELEYITEQSIKVFKELCFKHNVSNTQKYLTYAMCNNEIDECFDFTKLLNELWQ